MYDDSEPTSEVYRLLPPRRAPSELRQALDAAQGVREPAGGPSNGGPPAPRKRPWVVPAAVRAASRRTALWLGSVITLAIAAAVGSALWALISHW